jgi:ATP-dependent Lhr-like helicase
LPPSVSDVQTAFDLLAPAVQRWVRDQGWRELREVQERAIRTIISSPDDVLIAASTAAGKTEAAFLPLLTKVAERSNSALTILYVSPLKALINDQFRRLSLLCETMEINVVRWHGDASAGPKQRMRKEPAGVVLITPESIEALLLRRPADAKRMFAGVEAIVIDELHAFLQGPRGLQLASLLRRVEALTSIRPQRVGLSATLGDLDVAAKWLNAKDASTVVRINITAGSPEIRIQVRGYEEPPDKGDIDELEGDGPPEALDLIADHMLKTLRGTNNLVFGGSRRTVEALADRLRRRSERASVPNEFFPHHGSLSKELREDLELRLKEGSLPTTGIATTTLELGIDIGSVESVAQVGAPRSLASLRQRLGRSGRREGRPAILRIYLREGHLAPDSDPLDRLRFGTARAVAAVRLLVAKFVEPPKQDPALATALLHQTLSVLTERGSLRPDVIFRALCGGGPFSAIQPADYVELLKGMGATDPPLLEQSPDGALLLGPLGERLTMGRDFYALFETDQEWRLVHGGRALGTIPISNLLGVGSLVAFAGRRWRVASVDDAAKVLDVEPHRAGRLPKFDRLYGEPIHDRLVQEVRTVYLTSDLPSYLDATATRFLSEGRCAFHDLRLNRTRLIPSADDTHVLTWRGSITNSCLAIALTAVGFECEPHDLGVTVAHSTPEEVQKALRQLTPVPTPEALSAFVENLRTAKYDELVPEPLLRRLWARAHSDECQELNALVEELSAGL